MALRFTLYTIGATALAAGASWVALTAVLHAADCWQVAGLVVIDRVRR